MSVINTDIIFTDKGDYSMTNNDRWINQYLECVLCKQIKWATEFKNGQCKECSERYLKCGKCKNTKYITEFYVNNSRKTGRSGHCKKCADSYPRRKNTGKGQKKKSKEHIILHKRFCVYKAGAKARKYTFLLTKTDFSELYYRPCHYCGGYSEGKGKPHCGIDRVDNTKGYELSNCVPCCSICNKWKSAWSHTFFVSHAAKITEHQIK